MTKRILTAALETGDLPAAVAALDQDVVFHSPILATTGNEVRGQGGHFAAFEQPEIFTAEIRAAFRSLR